MSSRRPSPPMNDLPSVQRHHAVALVLSIWACNSAMVGKFQLSQSEYRWIQNAGINSAKMLPRHLERRATDIVGELIKRGLVSTENFDRADDADPLPQGPWGTRQKGPRGVDQILPATCRGRPLGPASSPAQAPSLHGG